MCHRCEDAADVAGQYSQCPACRSTRMLRGSSSITGPSFTQTSSASRRSGSNTNLGRCHINAPQHAAAGPDHLPAVSVLRQQPAICLHGWGLLMICMGVRTPCCLPSRGGTPFHALSGPAHRPIHPLRQGVGRRTVAISTGRGSATRSDISSCPQSRTGTSPLAVVP